MRECMCVCSWAAPDMLKDQSGLSPLDVPDKKPSDAATAVVGTSLPHPVPSKPESVFSLTSQCSYSSTIVHVGDKKPQVDPGTVVCGGVCVCGPGGWESISCTWLPASVSQPGKVTFIVLKTKHKRDNFLLLDAN